MVISFGEKVADTVIAIILVLIGLICVIPLLYVFSVSLTPMSEVLKSGGLIIFPKHITFSAYAELFRQDYIPRSFFVTLFITVVGTAVNLILTILLAYPLSRRNLPGRSGFLLFIVFTMLFSGGMIPTYLIVKQFQLIDTIWALILPNAVWTFNTLVMKSYFESIPEEMFESAKMDGAGESIILVRILVPLSLPVIMTILLFYMVGHWNEFFQAILYITKRELFPLQVIVRQIILQSNMTENVDVTIPTQTLQSAVVIFACLPVILVYPFIQKYFTKGVMLGAIKG